jgi:hypothetical protein
MTRTNRRSFLKQTGLGVVGISSLNLPSTARAAGSDAASALPPHEPRQPLGVHAYPLEQSLAAGDTLELCVSADVPYDLSFCRLGLAVDDPAQDAVLADLGRQTAFPQPIHPGSYVHIEKGLRGAVAGLTLEAWVRPWDPTRLQGILSQEDKDSSEGFALGMGPDGYVGFYLGDGVSPDERVIHRTPPGTLKKNRWQHVVATWDGQKKRVFVEGREAGAWNFSGTLAPGNHPLRLGAMAQGGRAGHFLDGDLAMPTVYRRALSETEVQARFAAGGLSPARGRDVLACWPLAEERGDRIEDVSGRGRHGRLVNHGTWMIGGPSFEANVPRFRPYDPARDPQRGHGLRLASDDLYDCRWAVTHRWRVPSEARSGIYVARMKFSYEGKPRVYHCTFIVRRAARRRRAPILLLTATNTWRAYNGTPFALTPPDQKQVWGTGGIGRNSDDFPSYCLYRGHFAGQGTYQVGLRMPWPAAGPYVLYGGATEYSHLMRADRFTQIWLEGEGYDYDVITDVDLHRNPSLPRGYRALLIVGHNEYWSLPMYRGVERYLQQGGNLLVLSGNTMGWRVSFDEDCRIMECRKVDAPGDQVPASRRGEAWHSHDGLRGGSQRECGMPGYRLIGLDIIGWNNQANPKNFGPYLAERADHFLFRTPEDSGLKAGDAFGWAGPGKLPMANGHEMDIRPSTFTALQQQPSPPDGVVPTDPPGMVRLANGVLPWKEGGQPMDYFWRRIQPATDQGAEMIYWERPEGGRVFNAGAIGSGWVLHADPRWATVVRNVLHHYGVPARGAA